MYEITQDYIKKGNARSGKPINKVRYLVAHDIGKGGSTAYQNRAYFHNHQPSASAHTFIDDKFILEIVPIYEKAWHVQYNTPIDNQLFGDDANDCAIGTELCHGPKINFSEAYKRYVWYHAYLCKTFHLNPGKDIVGHYVLDPKRRSDPIHAFKQYGITWNQFIEDVQESFKGNEVVNLYFKLGDKGAGIGTYQSNLKAIGYTIEVDNSFGPATELVTRQFQEDHDLTVDGKAGPQTLGKLAEIIQKQNTPKESQEVVLNGKKYKIIEQ